MFLEWRTKEYRRTFYGVSPGLYGTGVWREGEEERREVRERGREGGKKGREEGKKEGTDTKCFSVIV